MTSHPSSQNHEDHDLHQADNSSISQSHGRRPPQSQPLAANRAVSGSNRVSSDRKAPTEITKTAADSKRSRSRVVPCKFYSTAKGCRAGEACPFLHASQPKAAQAAPTESSHEDPVVDDTTSAPSSTNIPSQPSNNVPRQGSKAPRAAVARPVPAAQQKDPRTFQLTQVERRFNPTRQDTEHGTVLVFKLSPSDPDFPFELDGLQCSLMVPEDYPQKDARPSLKVSNPEMELGFRVNVERGFGALVAASPNRTLLALLNELDKNLEAFLTAQKAQTIKIIAHSSGQKAAPTSVVSDPPQQPVAPAAPAVKSTPKYSDQQKANARSKRETDVRQLEARLRNVPGFSKSSDDRSFNVPLSIPKPARLPASIRPVKEVTLIVPTLYNLEPSTIKLKGVYGEEPQYVEKEFEEYSRADPTTTLMAQINHLSQNMHVMAKVEQRDAQTDVPAAMPVKELPAASSIPPKADSKDLPAYVDVERPHIQYIPRPPEWDQGSDSDGDSSETDSEEYSESEEDGADVEEGGASLPTDGHRETASNNSILVSFPDIELYGIELMELASMNLTLKCERCKSTVDAKNIKAKFGDVKTTVTESCPKCSTMLSVSFTSEPIHANSIKAGHLDLTACTVADMLPSVFKPTCSGCSTTFPTPPGVMSVRGATTLAVCRECHQKMTFKLPEVKFLRVSSALASNLPLRQKKKRENLGITSGTPLPDFGRCSHYRKSQRWFRFSCCDKVWPCDRCHDSNSDPKHVVEHANRMICGYCSREQNYRPEDCGVCGHSLVGRKGRGFWEGGTGTRDRMRMSRKDPRKYKRNLGGSTKKKT